VACDDTAFGVPGCILLRRDIADLANSEPASVDWIVTDPPYPREYLPLYDDLARGAAHVLRPGGGLLCMTGQTWLPAVMFSLAEHLRYHWTLAYLTPGGQAVQVFPRRVNTFWKPVLLFAAGDLDAEWFGDVTRSDTNDNDKEHHDWGQSESGMYDLMRRFVRPGQVVMDPFLGGGTTAVVALALGASFIGSDVSSDAIATTQARLADAATLAA
jgi:site-specific DNA-methyltransferase (adenine-specific)